MEKPKKQGRPPIPKSQRKTYERVAVYPKTKKRIIKNAKKVKKSMVDYLEEIIE